ncbi:GumC family protein [Calothrix sp. 336/3]|uniref:GumC family protein n=1 Tax=Calothrix sp. 336/3 TaxID=1337936 RepID=UPI0004E315C5|nr:polysaccharide biosynthesis tyrosine autokinase [Calothrix sp. 336/3]AKG23989.1 capsular biosynthesis protein [Calothrix sp. 336/3]
MDNNNYSRSINYQEEGKVMSPTFPQSLSPWSELPTEDWNLSDFLSTLQRRGLIIVGVATVVMMAVVYSTVRQKTQYEGSFRLLVEPLDEEIRVLDIDSQKNGSSGKSNLDYDSQIQVLKSPELMTGIIKRLKASQNDIDYANLVNGLTINRLGETKILEVRYKNGSPEKTKAVLDEISQAYLNYSLEKRQTSLRQGVRFVDQQLQIMQKRVDQLQKDLQIFRQKNNFVDPENQTQQISNQINLLSQQRLDVNKQLANIRASWQSLRQNQGKLGVLNNSSTYEQLLAQVRQIETQIATESTKFQSESPTIQSLKEKRESLLPLLRQEAQRVVGVKQAEVATQMQILEVQNQELAKAENKLEQKRQKFPILTRQYTEMQRKLQVATESLNRFLSTRETLQIQVAQTELPWQVIQGTKVPREAIAPNIQRNLTSGFIFSLILGIGSALLIEKLDNTYHSLNGLKAKVKLPILGVIPFEKLLHHGDQSLRTRQLAIAQIPDSVPQDISPGTNLEVNHSSHTPKFVEALRVLHTNLQLLSGDRPTRSIVVSSAMSQDGKSTIAFHLAEVAAAMGQRVLLVDADMRQPKIHQMANLNNHWGLSNLISNGLPITEVICQAPFSSQLFIITAGKTPPDPTKLLSSEKMKRLMAEFQQQFDLVIYDSPPVLGLADASWITPQTDGMLLVVRINQTNSSTLKRALDNLKITPMNVLGMVVNGQNKDFGRTYNY